MAWVGQVECVGVGGEHGWGREGVSPVREAPLLSYCSPKIFQKVRQERCRSSLFCSVGDLGLCDKDTSLSKMVSLRWSGLAAGPSGLPAQAGPPMAQGPGQAVPVR